MHSSPLDGGSSVTVLQAGRGGAGQGAPGWVRETVGRVYDPFRTRDHTKTGLPMRTLPVACGVAAAAAATAIALTGCSGPAATAHHPAITPPPGSAATGGWRGVELIGTAGQAWAGGLVADAPGDAWSTWQSCTACQSARRATLVRVEHWDGSRWAQVAVPRALAGAAGSAVAIGASSAGNAWLVGPGLVLRWDGSRWRAQPIPAWVTLGSAGVYKVAAEVFGPGSAWVFSLDRNSSPTPYYAARYTGGSWSKVGLPGSPDEVSALSPDDIWVLGATRATAATSNPATILMHWDGTSWSTVAAPTVSVSSAVTVNDEDLVAAGPDDVWLVRETQVSNSDGQTVITGTYLLHWDGTSWARVAAVLPAQTGVDAMAQDGAGGLWLAGSSVTGSGWGLYHYTAGRWATAAVPGGSARVSLTGLSWIPGTRSLWATGNLLTGDATSTAPWDGLILEQGR
jgi:hypothetical protein